MPDLLMNLTMVLFIIESEVKDAEYVNMGKLIKQNWQQGEQRGKWVMWASDLEQGRGGRVLFTDNWYVSDAQVELSPVTVLNPPIRPVR